MKSSDYNVRRAASPTSEARQREWLRVRAAAKYLGVGVGTLNKLRTYGGGPPYAKLGHTVVYDPNDLDDWASARKVRKHERARAGRLIRADHQRSHVQPPNQRSRDAEPRPETTNGAPARERR